MPNNYILENNGFITASKLKTYKRNPEEFWLQYIKNVDIKDKGRHFLLGNASDYLFSCRIEYGMKDMYKYESLASGGEMPKWVYKSEREESDDMKWFEEWSKKYYIDEGFVKEELKASILDKKMYETAGVTVPEVKEMKLPELRAIYYQEDGETQRLTPAEGRDIVGMYKELLRQPAMDFLGASGVQVVIETTYKGLPIRGTLDRFYFVDSEGTRYMPDDVDLFIEANGKEEWVKFVEEKGVIGMIRDWKTTRGLDTFNYDAEYKFDYIFSMSFYYVLVRARYGVKSNAYLDAIEKKSPYPSKVYKLDRNAIVSKIKSEIKPLLEEYMRAEKNDAWDAIEPLTGQPVSRDSMMKSKFYPYMKASIQKDAVESL